MSKNYSYKNYFNIINAMQTYNTIMPGKKFTLLDANLLCIVKSFHESNNKFYMSNEQLSKLLFSCEKTVRTSINRLCDAQLLKKEYMDGHKFKGRYLIYQDQNMEKFIAEMQFAAKNMS